MLIHEIIEKVTAMSKQAERIKFLKENRSEILDWVFIAATRKFGLTSNSAIGMYVGGNANLHIEEMYTEIQQLFDKFEARELTGNAAIEALRNLLINLHPDDGEVIFNILDSNLKCGVSFETYETKVMCKKSSKFEVTLAYKLEEVNGVDPLDGTWFASRKCDGVRCTARVDINKQEVTFISRRGNEFTMLDKLKPEVLNFCKPLTDGVWYLDGELCKVDENGDEHFDQIVGECKRKNYTIEECCYQLFDIVTEDIFNGKVKSTNFQERYETLIDIEHDYLLSYLVGRKCFIKVLHQERIKSQEDFDAWRGYVEKGNWEGFMLRKDVPFETGRTKNLLKVKKFQDAEFTVKRCETGIITSPEPGKGNVKYEGVSALVIEYKGNEVHVGAGLTKEQRKEWFDCPDHIIGKTICVKYFQESKDKTGKPSLRFPTLKYVYNGERDL